MIVAYTDGSALGNPGPGGYGVVLISQKHNLRKEFSKGYKLTTNNRMELLSVIVALEALKQENRQIVIHSDSQYVVNSIEKGWLWQWEKKGFSGKKNVDLWQRFIPLYRKHSVKMKWVRGHAGVPENERCDVLANQAARTPDLEEDRGYKAGEV